MKTDRIKLMSEAPVSKALFQLGIPMVISMLVTALYNVVDTYFVSGLGKQAVAAVSVAFPISLIFSGIGLTFGAGAGSYISRLLGKKDKEMAERVASTAMFSSIVTGLLVAVMLLLALNPVLKFMGAIPSIFDLAKDYAVLFIISTIFSTANVTAGNLAVAQGASNISLTAMISGAVLNVILDPICITSLNMGVRGAAVATLISQIVTSAIYVWFFVGGKSYLRIAFSKFKPSVGIYGEILKVGVSMLLLQLLSSLSMSRISAAAGVYGEDAIAAKRNAERLAKGEMYACPSCGDPLEFDAEMCENCGAFIDKETRQLRTQVSDAELQKNIDDSKARFNKAKAVMVTGGILLALSVFFSGNLIFILISAAVLIVGIYGTSAEMALVKRQLNRAVIPQILSEYFEDVVYNPEGTVPLDQVSEAFWGEYNRHMGSDYIKCRYHGIDIEVSDLTLEKVTYRTVTDEKGNTKQEEEVETLLHGQWMIFDFHKQLSANVRLLANTKKRKDGIETENMAFNNKFRISSSSPHDAFYVLTPHMMEHILQVTANAGGNVDFMFMMDGKLHLAMHTHTNHFETGDLKNTSLDALRDKFRGEIDFILSVVNELKDELLSL